VWQVAVDGAQTTAVFEPATSGKSAAVFVAGHGAGSHRDHRSMVQLAQVLRGRGFGVVRFNFLYREQGSGVPDRMPRLQACFSSVTERVRHHRLVPPFTVENGLLTPSQKIRRALVLRTHVHSAEEAEAE